MVGLTVPPGTIPATATNSQGSNKGLAVCLLDARKEDAASGLEAVPPPTKPPIKYKQRGRDPPRRAVRSRLEERRLQRAEGSTTRPCSCGTSRIRDSRILRLRDRRRDDKVLFSAQTTKKSFTCRRRTWHRCRASTGSRFTQRRRRRHQAAASKPGPAAQSNDVMLAKLPPIKRVTSSRSTQR